MKKLILIGSLLAFKSGAIAQIYQKMDPAIQNVDTFSAQKALVAINQKWYFWHLGESNHRSDGYEAALPYREGYAAVKVAGKWHFIDTAGNKRGGNEHQYDEVHSFSNGRAAVLKVEAGWGFINTNFEIVKAKPSDKDFPYLRVEDFFNNRCKVVTTNKKQQMIDTNGTVKMTNLHRLGKFSNNRVYSGNLEGTQFTYMDGEGEVKIKYYKNTAQEEIKQKKGYAGTFMDGYAPVSTDVDAKLLQYIDINGVICRWEFKDGLYQAKNDEPKQVKMRLLHQFSCKRAAIRAHSKWRFIDTDGQFVNQESYDEVTPFSENVAAVRQNEHWHFIDLHGQKLTPFFEAAKPCTEGIAWVKQEGHWGLISFLKKPVVKINSPQTAHELLVDTALIVKAEIISPVLPQKVTLYLNDHLVADQLSVTRKNDTTFYVEQRTCVKMGLNTIRVVASNSLGEDTDTRTIQCDTTIKYYGLMIANNKYNSINPNLNYGELTNPINDATKLRTTLLNDYNFTAIDTLYNGTLEEMKAAFQALACKYNQEKAHILIFYSGHGQTNGALCPAPTAKGAYELFTACDTKEHIGLLTNVAHVLLIIDACYAGGWKCDNPKNQKTVVVSECDTEVSKIEIGKSRAILTAAENKKVNDDAIFVQVLLDVLKKNEAVELEQTKLVSKIRDGEMKHGIENYPQWYSLNLLEDDGKFFKFRKSMRAKQEVKMVLNK